MSNLLRLWALGRLGTHVFAKEVSNVWRDYEMSQDIDDA
jgi:hypothetical protein